MRFIPRTAAILILAAGIAGCEESPTAPTAEVDEIALALSIDDSETGARNHQVGEHPPVLNKLFQIAIKRLRAAEGAEAAQEILEEIRRLTAAAAEARAAGDLVEAERLIGEVQQIKAEVVIRILGTGVVDRLMTVVDNRIKMMENRIRAFEASGRPVPERLQELVDEGSALLAAARSALAAGDAEEALILASKAFDLLSFHRHLGR